MQDFFKCASRSSLSLFGEVGEVDLVGGIVSAIGGLLASAASYSSRCQHSHSVAHM